MLIEEKNFPLFEEVSSSGYYWTCLHYACFHGYEEIVEYYLQNINDDAEKFDKLSLEDSNGQSPLSQANQLQNKSKKAKIFYLFVKYTSIEFVEKSTRLSQDEINSIIDVFKKIENNEEIKKDDLLRAKFLKNNLDNKQKRDLYDCKCAKNLKYLIEEKGYPLFEECSAPGYYWTCLHYACYHRHVDIVQYYLEKCKNDPHKLEKLSLPDNHSHTALYYAVNNRDKNTALILSLFLDNTSLDFIVECCNLTEEEILQIINSAEDITTHLESFHLTQDLSHKGLPNSDLRKRFLQRPLVKEYIGLFITSGSLNTSPDKYSTVKGVFKEIKEDLDELFERFGITYQLPSMDYTQDCESYRLILSPSSEMDLDLYIPLFFLEFSLYTPEYIKKSKIKSVYFVGYLTFATDQYSQYRAACPEWGPTESLYYCTNNRSLVYNRNVVHHEFYHYVDWVEDYSLEDPEWNKFNVTGFVYGQGGHLEREWKPLDPSIKGFLNFYSTTSLCEDTAEIFAYLMTDTNKLDNQKDQIILSKVDYMKKFLLRFDEQFNDTYWSELANLRKMIRY
jgi:ankyrin repeat protein